MKSGAFHLRNISLEQKESAQLIAILMKVARSVDELRIDPGSLEHFVMGALEAQASILRLATCLYPESGSMERSVLAFATRLDLDLSPQNFRVYSNAIH